MIHCIYLEIVLSYTVCYTVTGSSIGNHDFIYMFDTGFYTVYYSFHDGIYKLFFNQTDSSGELKGEAEETKAAVIEAESKIENLPEEKAKDAIGETLICGICQVLL